MKLVIAFIGIICFAGTANKIASKNKFENPAITKTVVSPVADTLTWIDDVKLFRTAVLQNNKAIVKKYFKFPVLNPSNEIWYLVLAEAEAEKRKLGGDKLIPFKEIDFDKYYAKLFPKYFLKSIMKVKFDQLFKKGEADSPEQKEGDTKYTMYAGYDKKAKILSFNLAYKTTIKGEEDAAESNVIYNFTVQKDRHIFF